MRAINWAAVKADGEREGRGDYLDRALDVAHGDAADDWAWPFTGADEAYIDAVGTGEICRRLGHGPAVWDEIAETRCAAFHQGYCCAYAVYQ
jgi:hypothetical protein